MSLFEEFESLQQNITSARNDKAAQKWRQQSHFPVGHLLKHKDATKANSTVANAMDGSHDQLGTSRQDCIAKCTSYLDSSQSQDLQLQIPSISDISLRCHGTVPRRRDH